MLVKDFNAVSKVTRRTEQCELPMQIVCIKLNFYDLATGSVYLHAITYQQKGGV